ncbi:MAG: tRNA (N(6)-L-threonylcarbamoyladenosine(37)-C(2))-methylthiotransferase MtaB, partial [Chloroflexi bacterium]|nr:tRNA (N(6)-L-threonylcarbamoyladenosine(37)-C(2))-methylthiotransferase MtaB [Chloroflexota bacterium]
MQDRVPRTVAIETHGCKLNLADSEVLARRFALAGFRVVGPDEEADIYLVNTCTVTRTADHKARQALRQAHRRSPSAMLVATGCYAQRAPQELAGLPGVSLVAGNIAKDELVERILSCQSTTLVVPCSRGQAVPRPHLPNHTRAFVKIQEGCN